MNATQAIITIITALISAGSALAVCLVQNRAAEKRAQEARQENQRLIEYKLDQLTHRVEVHNHLIERMYKVEEVQARQDEQIKTLFNQRGD